MEHTKEYSKAQNDLFPIYRKLLAMVQVQGRKQKKLNILSSESKP